MMTLTMDRDRQATMSGLRMTHTVSPAIFMTSLWMLKTNKVSHNLELKKALKDHTALLKAQSSTVRLKDLARMVPLKSLRVLKDMLDQLHTYITWVLSLDHSRAPIKIVSRLLNQVINSSLPVSVTSTTQSSATSRANLMPN